MKSIQFLKAAANKLRDGKLKRLGAKEVSDALNGMIQTLGLDTKDEAIVFAALFDRSCGGRCSDLDDLASYFGASQLDVMEYVPALRSLEKKGFIVLTDRSECRIGRQNFMVTNYVIGCVLENKKPNRQKATILEKEFDKYDLCKLVSSQVQDDDVTTESLFQFVESAEHDNATMPLVKDLKAILPSLPDRTLFYEMCNDYVDTIGDGRTNVNSTLRDMYQAYGIRFKVRKSLIDGTNPLIAADLIELSNDRDDMALTTKGQKLFLGEDFGAFGQQYTGLNLYSFARIVKEYVHSRDHDAEKPGAMKKLAEKICVIEESNRSLECLPKIQEVIREEDFRALFYIACDACANGGTLSVSRELGEMYPIKQRNKYIKEFKEEIHKLQRLDLMEMVTLSSIFGEYTVLQLTDKGKELYFGEDASLFIEKPEKKNLICAADIKEKHLFFSEKEQIQLNLVGDSLEDSNYNKMVSRLEEKGLPKGMAILLYGAPGTGKTESVMQWARSTGRDIIHVDISASKSMWYGESEKIIKEIFTKYKRQCKSSKLKPILLFNEADAIFASRKTGNNSSLDQTENAIQNIILEEMERLDGILIATTNLADNLDKAFERRFLFKIRFDKPTVEAKTKIWRDKLSALTEEQAHTLASRYDFSGGEIDNIVRKSLMAEVLEGKAPSFNEIERLCSEEKIGKSSVKSIGFNIKS
ncbi:MAG: ATP-binding protein [Muribaculaceae bacterium]|nr:ATP-binding protein [Muribaculaceae bacterium]